MNEPEPFGRLIVNAAELMATDAVRSKVVRTRYTEEREPISELTRVLVLRRSKYRCDWCASPERLEIDHIVPWSAGGSNEIENLRTLCHDCNTKRSNRVRPLDEVEVLPTTDLCVRCDPERCVGDLDLRLVYCLTCSARASGIPREVDKPNNFGIRIHPKGLSS